ncbi:MAG: cytochrome c [Chloroflexi bacterium]|nr:cytochrome c [Chloroflexota bacterium]
MFVLAACGAPSNDGQEPSGEATTELGQRLYQTHCATCHGPEGEGEPGWQSPREDGTYQAPPHDSSGHTWHHSDEALLDIIRRGGQAVYGREGFRSRMPAWGDALSDEEISAVLEYIKTFWGAEEREFQASLD